MDRAAHRQLLLLTFLVTAGSSALTLLTTRGDWQATLLVLPLSATAAYWSLRFARRLTKRAAASATARHAPPPDEPPSSARPEHARRRRQRRRARGRGE
ncbi:MAG: hypothetical protein EXR63_01540 [Dehalococcoidia bacterium]|nr:hypothetical protein [Dehalococcoidia bacterium]